MTVQSSGSFTMNGGTISGNKASNHCGGVYVTGDSSFTMTGGTITGNTAAAGYYGGGVYVTGNNSSFTMTGGTISDNKASLGGGVYFNNGNVCLGGDAKITGNTGAYEENNLYLKDKQTVTVGTGDNLPKDGMNIGVTTYRTEAPIAITTNGTAADVKYFRSDKSEYLVYLTVL